MSSSGGTSPPESVPKIRNCVSHLDYRNGDLVSRLLAATPPYLYNMPLVPQSFFFSEMLRSFVQAKNDISQPVHVQRRSRKRAWRDANKPTTSDKPLELTTTKNSAASEEKNARISSPPPNASHALAPPLLMPPCTMLPPDPTLPSDMILPPPPPPPLWYPPLYSLPSQSSYGIDPLHFFIDLRVSGQTQDKSKERSDDSESGKSSGDEPVQRPPSAGGSTSSALPQSLIKQTKHSSAFSVPQPRSQTELEEEAKRPKGTSNINYVMQNLGRIYEDLRKRDDEEGGSDKEERVAKSEGEESEEDKKARCKDLRALIGLELVVDYVKQEDVPKAGKSEDLSEATLDVVSSDKDLSTSSSDSEVASENV